MKFIKKFNESKSIKDIVSDIKELFLDISDDYDTKFEWESDGLDVHHIDIIINTTKFIDDKTYDNKKYSNGYYDVVSQYNNINSITDLLKHYNNMIDLYNKLETSLNRLKIDYPKSYYKIIQRDLNYSSIKIEIYIDKYETE